MLPKYIKWTQVPVKYVDADELNALLAKWKADGAKVASTKTVKKEWYSAPIVYSRKDSGSWVEIFYSIADEDGIHSLGRLQCHRYKNAADLNERKAMDISGADCKEEMETRFTKETGTTFMKAFGTVNAKFFRPCVPKPFYYMRRSMAYHNIPGAQYIDVSAMYPSCARGLLPDEHTMKIVKGRVEPNEEYRFAFYLASHHCAEYGVFDTHNYEKDLSFEMQKWQCFTDEGKAIYNKVKDEEELTVLMRPAQYELTNVMNSFWADRFSEDESVKKIAKAVSVMGIGALAKNPDNCQKFEDKAFKMKDYYHIVAIIKGRANKLQHDMVKKIQESGGLLLQGIVDSLIYVGGDDFGADHKEFGEYYNEFGKINYRCTTNINQYVLFDENNEIKQCRVAGVKNGQDKVHKPEDIDQFGGK